MEYKYKNLSSFRKENLKEYSILSSRGLLGKLCLDMGWDPPFQKNKWSIKENVLEEARKFKTITDWNLKSKRSLQCARVNGWMEECTAHMETKKYWSKEKCLDIVRTYTSFRLWKRENKDIFKRAEKEGWLDECLANIKVIDKPEPLIKPKKYWNEERCLEEALKHETRNAWKNASPNSYSASLKKPWRDKCTAHMKPLKQNKVGFWTDEKCFESALKFTSKSEWQKHAVGAVTYARKNGIFDDCVKHMVVRKTMPHRHWYIKENCLAEALKYKSKIEWQTHGKGSVGGAIANGWYEECTAHMK